MSTDTVIDFTVTFAKGKLDELEKSKGDHECNGLEKFLKLYTTSSTTNMHLFDENEILHKYDKVSEIIDSYYDVRLQLYQDRKNKMIECLNYDLMMLTNKAKYIQENINGTIDLRQKSKDVITKMLEDKKYDKMKYEKNDEDDNYKYLIKMPMDSVSEENINKLLKEKGNKEEELLFVQNTTIYTMWKIELDKLKEQYIEYKEFRSKLANGEYVSKVVGKKKVVSKGVVTKKTLTIEKD
jgi:DNA topoisomerase-2